MTQTRSAVAALVAPVLALTGFRFSKSYRHGATRVQALVWRCCSTVEANRRADQMVGEW